MNHIVIKLITDQYPIIAERKAMVTKQVAPKKKTVQRRVDLAGLPGPGGGGR